MHHFSTPFRSLVVAPSGSGESNFITNLISLFCKVKGVQDRIFIFCKSRDEPLYQFLGDKSKWLILVHKTLEKLPALNNLQPSEQTLIIFDDIVNDLKKYPISSEYFIRGRNKVARWCFFLNHTIVLLRLFDRKCIIG